MITQQGQSVLIIGAGPGGAALLDIFSKEKGISVRGVVDNNLDAVGIKLAQSPNRYALFLGKYIVSPPYNYQRGLQKGAHNSNSVDNIKRGAYNTNIKIPLS